MTSAWSQDYYKASVQEHKRILKTHAIERASVCAELMRVYDHEFRVLYYHVIASD
jgi:hypothetical protein